MELNSPYDKIDKSNTKKFFMKGMTSVHITLKLIMMIVVVYNLCKFFKWLYRNKIKSCCRFYILLATQILHMQRKVKQHILQTRKVLIIYAPGFITLEFCLLLIFRIFLITRPVFVWHALIYVNLFS